LLEQVHRRQFVEVEHRDQQALVSQDLHVEGATLLEQPPALAPGEVQVAMQRLRDAALDPQQGGQDRDVGGIIVGERHDMGRTRHSGTLQGVGSHGIAVHESHAEVAISSR
jgi:hypothetical protein